MYLEHSPECYLPSTQSKLSESYFTKDNYQHLKVKNGSVVGSRKMTNNRQTEDSESSIYNYLYLMHCGSSGPSCSFGSLPSLRTKPRGIQRLVSKKTTTHIRAHQGICANNMPMPFNAFCMTFFFFFFALRVFTAFRVFPSPYPTGKLPTSQRSDYAITAR